MYITQMKKKKKKNKNELTFTVNNNKKQGNKKDHNKNKLENFSHFFFNFACINYIVKNHMLFLCQLYIFLIIMQFQ